MPFDDLQIFKDYYFGMNSLIQNKTRKGIFFFLNIHYLKNEKITCFTVVIVANISIGRLPLLKEVLSLRNAVSFTHCQASLPSDRIPDI